MAWNVEDAGQVTKVSGTFRPAGKGAHDDADLRVGYAATHLPTTVAWLSGIKLTHF